MILEIFDKRSSKVENDVNNKDVIKKLRLSVAWTNVIIWRRQLYIVVAVK